MKNNRLYLYLLLAWMCYLEGTAQQAWTLKQCIDYALQRNIQVKQQSNQLEKLKIERKRLKAEYLPDLKAGISQKFDFGRSLNRNNMYEDNNSQSSSFSLTTEMPVFTGFRLSGSIAKNKYDLLAAQENKTVIENDLALSITSCYFQILLNKEMCKIAEEQIMLTKEQEKNTQLLIENGKVPQSQLFDIRAQLADDELTATEAKNTLRLSILDLLQMMELDGQTTFDVMPLERNGDFNDYRPDEIYITALTCMPQIKGAYYNLQSSLKAIKVAKSGYYPTVSFGAGISSGYYHASNVMNISFNDQFRNNMQKSIYLSLSIPLFDRLSTRNQVRTAKIEARNARLVLENEKKTLYKDIEKAYTDATGASEKLKSTSKAVVANEEAHRYALEKYAAGKSTVYEYNETKWKLANALSQYVQAKYTYLLKRKILNFYACQSLVE